VELRRTMRPAQSEVRKWRTGLSCERRKSRRPVGDGAVTWAASVGKIARRRAEEK
jgi:hypothetical protein